MLIRVKLSDLFCDKTIKYYEISFRLAAADFVMLRDGVEMGKYHIEKNTVQETLIIPLYGRKVCSERFPELFKDNEAERICNMLDYDFAEKGK